MKTCYICKKVIEPSQSKRGTGNGWAHTYCLIPKTVRPAHHIPNTKKLK